MKPWEDECQRRLLRVLPIPELEAEGIEPIANCGNGDTRGMFTTPGSGLDKPYIVLGFNFDHHRTSPWIHDIEGTYARIYFQGPYKKFRGSVEAAAEALQALPGCRVSHVKKPPGKTVSMEFRCGKMRIPQFKRNVKMILEAAKK